MRFGELNTAADVYSFAMVCVALWTGGEPWAGAGDRAIQGSVCDGKRPPLPDDGTVPPAIRTLIELCWAHKPTDRPTFGELKAISVRHEALLCAPTVRRGSSGGVDDGYPRFLRQALEEAEKRRAALGRPASRSMVVSGRSAPLATSPVEAPLASLGASRSLARSASFSLLQRAVTDFPQSRARSPAPTKVTAFLSSAPGAKAKPLSPPQPALPSPMMGFNATRSHRAWT